MSEIRMKYNDFFKDFIWNWLAEFDFEKNTAYLCLIGLSFSSPWSLPALFRSFALCYKARLEYKTKIMEINYKLRKNTASLEEKASKRLKTL